MDVADIEQWIGREVISGDDEKVGKLTDVFYADGVALLGEIKSGVISKKTHLVPLENATVTRDDIRVTYETKLIKAAPSTEDGLVTPDELRAVEAAYDVRFEESQLTTLESASQREARIAEAQAAQAEAQQLRAEADRLRDAAERADDEAERAAKNADQARAAYQSAQTAAQEAESRAKAVAV